MLPEDVPNCKFFQSESANFTPARSERSRCTEVKHY